MYDQTATIEGFLNAAAAKQPTPGGGSVAALTGALAAAMGEMVLNYSVGKKGLESHSDAHKAALAEFHGTRMMLVELMQEDQSAFETLTAARKLPEDSPRRREAIAAAMMLCVRVPQTIAATTVAILDLADQTAPSANQHLLSDLAVCAELAMAATRAAIYNVRVNLREILDTEQRKQVQMTCDQILAHAVALVRRIEPGIWKRIEQG